MSGSFYCCSIEDPFESSYDVAHVIKAAQMLHIRKEFLVIESGLSSGS